jgi:hypothetical protein
MMHSMHHWNPSLLSTLHVVVLSAYYDQIPKQLQKNSKKIPFWQSIQNKKNFFSNFHLLLKLHTHKLGRLSYLLASDGA